MKNQKGFTMVELTIVLAMIGIISAIAIPSIYPLIRESRVKAETRKVVNMLSLARISAIRDGTTTTVKISANEISMVQSSVTASGTKTSKTIKSVKSDRDNIYFACNYKSLSFDALGILSTEITAGIPTVTVTDGKSEYYVEVNMGGLAKVVPMKQI